MRRKTKTNILFYRFCFTSGLLLVLVSILLLLSSTSATAAPNYQTAETGQVIFQQRCTGCHTIGSGKLAGPDLEGVLTRRDPAWVKNFISNPTQMIADGDPIALDLVKQYTIEMPYLALSVQEVDSLLMYLENPSAAPEAVPPVQQLTGGVLAGQKLFSGDIPLQAGGTSCIACHTVSGTGQMGGGTLGPDLTKVLTRYGGEAGLSGALSTLPFPTMQGIFANKILTAQEQADLVVYFAWADGKAPVQTRNNSAIFLAAGTVGTIVLFGVMAFFWPRQRESLSQRLRKQNRRH
ncbi:MAG: cytochrome C [Chloroflexi bacterium]|nr:MAG: cytochrome C [Chloroflexota bacterium]